MLNNGSHYVVEFNPEIADLLGLASNLWGVWPSKLDEIKVRNRLFRMSNKVHSVFVEGCRLRSISAVKDRNPGTKFDIDISKIDLLPDEVLSRIVSDNGRLIN